MSQPRFVTRRVRGHVAKRTAHMSDDEVLAYLATTLRKKEDAEMVAISVLAGVAVGAGVAAFDCGATAITFSVAEAGSAAAVIILKKKETEIRNVLAARGMAHAYLL